MKPRLAVVSTNQQTAPQQEDIPARLERWARLQDTKTLRECANILIEQIKTRSHHRTHLDQLSSAINTTHTPDSLKAAAEDVLAFLSTLTGHSYSVKNRAGRPTAYAKHLIQRLQEGYSPDEIRAVCAIKAREWKGTDMEKYLSPDTLFRPTKFDKYFATLKH